MDSQNKRLFPRIQVNCPVLYRQTDNSPWKVGKILDMSATGIRFTCNDKLAVSSTVHVHVKPGSKKNIPEIKASGKVVRCTELDDGGYSLSCNLTRISNSLSRAK